MFWALFETGILLDAAGDATQLIVVQLHFVCCSTSFCLFLCCVMQMPWTESCATLCWRFAVSQLGEVDSSDILTPHVVDLGLQGQMTY